jgi:predicted DNA-binding transcriptional regulator AlpA
MTEHQILGIEDVAKMLQVSRSTIDRWCEETREGHNDFPCPFSFRGRKQLWTADIIQEWIQRRQSAANPPVNVPTTSKERRQEQKAYQERQRKADQSLERHRRNRKAKSKSGDR